MHRRRVLPPPAVTTGPRRVLVISASMGAGHDGAARTLAEQLRADGHVAEVRDFLDSAPLRIGAALRRGYELELKHLPSAYDATYRFWHRAPWLRPVLTWLVALLTRRRVMTWVDDLRPHVVVSTYPLSTLCLGRLRRTGRLGVPAVNFITDFGVHPLWVHPGIDRNLAVHDGPADDARRRTRRPSVACGPAVATRFAPSALPDKADARDHFGIPASARAVLIVAGSWGVGDLASTWRAVVAGKALLPVVVCGRDEKLRRDVERLTRGTDSVVVGWTDEMPALMVACDALVENAGGLTSLEAMAAGLPVVSFDPIAGHGKANTAAMHAAGVARLARDTSELHEALAAVTAPGPERDEQISAARSMFRDIPATAILDAARMPAATARKRLPFPMRILAGGTALAGVIWAGLTTGVAMATEAGAGVAHPAKNSGPVAYVGVRLSSTELEDPAIQTDVRHLHATVVLDDGTAQNAASTVRALVADGVTVANGGAGDAASDAAGATPWQRATADARAGRQISDLIDTPITQSVPGRRLTIWDLVESSDAHTSLVVPNHTFNIVRWSGTAIDLHARDIYLVNGLHATADETEGFLSLLAQSFTAAQLVPEPLGTLT